MHGQTTAAPVRESDPTRPLNPYGPSELAAGDLLRWAVSAGRVDATALRSFDVAGAGRPALTDGSRIGPVPILVERMHAGLPPTVFGPRPRRTPLPAPGRRRPPVARGPCRWPPAPPAGGAGSA